MQHDITTALMLTETDFNLSIDGTSQQRALTERHVTSAGPQRTTAQLFQRAQIPQFQLAISTRRRHVTDSTQ